jgi:serralysin
LAATAMTIQDGAGDDRIIASDLADTVTWKAGGGSINVGGGDDLLIMHTLKRGVAGPEIMLFGDDGRDTLRVTNGLGAQGVLDLGTIFMTGFERFVLAANAELRLGADSLESSRLGEDASFQLAKGATLTIVSSGVSEIDLQGLTIAGSGRVQVVGKASGDVLTGNAASRDVLLGGGDRDVLSGLGGADRLNGGTGNDTLTGGAGRDVFVFARAGGMDVITDFAGDGIDLRGMDGVTGLADLKKNHARNVGEDVVLRFGQGDQLVLEGVSKAELKAEFFLF